MITGLILKLAARTGLPAGLIKFIGLILGIAALVGLVWFSLDRFGDARYNDGRKDEKQVWLDAEEALRRKAEDASREADRRKAIRDQVHAAQVATEREKIDEAVREDRSPLDVLFGTDGM